MLDWVFLTPLRRYSEVGFLALRMFVGVFLLWSVCQKILMPSRLDNLVIFLDRNNMPSPEVLAQLTLWAQFSVGMAFVLGLFTRWAGVICAVNFSVATALVARSDAADAAFAPAFLAAAGLYLAFKGAGRFGFDSLFEAPAERGALHLG